MSSYEYFDQRIRQASTIVIAGHGYPDGDCYGCQIGLRDTLRATFPDKKVYAIGSGVPLLFPILGEMDELTDQDIEGALGILVDVSCLRRVEDQRFLNCSEFLKFDHHEPNDASEYFDGPAITDNSRVSCAEIVLEFVKSCGYEIPKTAAEAFYTGIVTDSGRFQYHGTIRKTFDDVDCLFKKGIRARLLIETIYHEEPEITSYKRWMRETASYKDGVCYLEVKPKDYQAFGLDFERASELVNALSGKFKANCYVYFCEREDGWVRVEYRSNRFYPVQYVARQFGGGGHIYAAGSDYQAGKSKIDDILSALIALKPLQ